MLAMEVLWLSPTLRYCLGATPGPISSRGRAAGARQRGSQECLGQWHAAGGVAGDRSQHRCDPQRDSWEPLCGKRTRSIAMCFPGISNGVSQELPCPLPFTGIPSKEPCSPIESTEESLPATETDLNVRRSRTHPSPLQSRPSLHPVLT